MIKSLKDYYDDFIIKRSDEVCNNLVENNEEYKALTQDATQKLTNLLNQLPIEQKNLLCEYEEKENERIAVLKGLIYYQGLKDGIYIKKTIRI